MHIMEGALPWEWALFWWGLTIIVLIAGIIQLNKVVRKNREVLPLLAVSGAFIFVLSSLKIPSPIAMSSSHPTGTGLSAITFGPAITAVMSAIVLLFQALLLAHGGLTTLGANCFSMGFFGPLLAWLVYKALQKTNFNIYITIFLAAFIADLATYIMTSFQLALAFGLETLPEFLGIFALTQIPLAVLEGLIIVVAVKFIAKVKGEFFISSGTLTEKQVAKMNE
ncbi:Cobalt transport protein CbiM [Methanimicrococcus sp. At1]|uniref:Putative cobalt transport protein CbiM n=1 Tax=Methanimicrococcus hacksteinii TaxID=3028293 RepID=A0ABU3VQ26_9EURY|nr:energy-coupling factor ABC transporter permease [Methanimicrococcus sp. At1]MDV0445518.1 Cobalt transport protein CbiM [Methanimicrococcus sp. At1]